MSLDSVNKRIKKLIKSCTRRNHRSLFVILGVQGIKQVPVFHEILMQRKVKEVPTLWCSKENTDIFLKNNIANLKTWQIIPNDIEGDASSASFHHCSYHDIDTISHRSYGLTVIQDFESLNLPILSAVIASVKGGGVILFLLPDIQNLDDLMTLNLNLKHKLSRFSKRFALSLLSCPRSLILDENLSILSSGPKLPENIEDNNFDEKKQLEELKQKNENDPLIGVCHTKEQAELLLNLIDVIKKKSFHAVCSLSSPVGRGKSAALGLAIAAAIKLNYSNIFISSMCHSNVNSVFRFLLKGLKELGYKEDIDFDLIESVNPKFKNALIGINIFRDHPQSVRFIFPGDIGQVLEQAELVVLDEAAAIPLQTLKQLFGPYVVLMASSISGPGSTSPYLYNNMINTMQPSSSLTSEGERFQKFTLSEPIHYASDDSIESWLNQVLCSGSSISSHLSCGFPIPEQCRLFCVCRDTLFGAGSQAENFLQSLMSLLSSSIRIMDPEYLLNLADSPNYRIFCLLPPVNSSHKAHSTIICAILVHLENEIPDNIIHSGINLNGSLSICFNEWISQIETTEPRFMPVRGAHILNIVTHQSYRKMGYGLRALQLLREFYEGKCINLDENLHQVYKADTTAHIDNGSSVETNSEPPLLQQLIEIQPENVDYILVACNLESQLLRFWKKVGFIPVFISERANFEGEHTLFMVKSVVETFDQRVEKYWYSFQNYYCTLLGSEYRNFKASLALNLLHFNTNFVKKSSKELTKADIDLLIRPHQMKSLEKYCQNLQDFHSIIQFIPTLATLFFKNHLKEIELSRVQEAILLSFGLQYKIADEISKDLGLPNMQIHGLLNRTLKKITKYLTDIIERSVEKTLENSDVVMKPIAQDLDEELEEAAKKIRQQQEVDALKLRDLDVSQYAIKGSEDDWQKALLTGRKALVSIKSIKAKSESIEDTTHSKQNFKKTKHQKKRKK